MPFALSVGDAILLSQIAWGIGQAFTSGRKSAPAEFEEVQGLLFTLSEALKVLAKDLPDINQVAQVEEAVEGEGEEAQADHVLLAQMMRNCQSTLLYLKSIVDNYMELDGKYAQKEQKRWKDEVKKNWKKLLWTQEGGDIIKLKTTLTAHINGLNLALSAINKRYGSEVRGHVESMHTKLDDIYEWFKQNLEGKNVATVSQPPQHQPSTEKQTKYTLSFAVSVDLMPGYENRKFHCPRARFRSNWLDGNNPFKTATSIFQCCCSSSSIVENHEEALHVSYLRDLNAEASRLSLVQARQHLLRNQSTSLVSFSAITGPPPVNDCSDRMISVLASKTEYLPKDDEEICTVSFRVGKSQFSATADAAYSILHYKSLPESILTEVAQDMLVRGSESVLSGGVAPTYARGFEVHQPHAEVLFREVNKRLGNGGESTYSVTLYYDTVISRGNGHRTARINNTLVVSERKEGYSELATVQQIKCDTVDIEFMDSQDSQTLLSSLHSMQSYLFHLYLTGPLFGERILFERFAGDMIVQDHLLSSTTLSLIHSPGPDTYRLILLADTQAVGVCMPLSPRQLEGLVTDENAGTKQFLVYFLVKDMHRIEATLSSIRFEDLVPRRTGAELHPLLSSKSAQRQDSREQE